MSAPVETPALYDVRIRHTRRAPLRNDFEYGADLWLVDLDEPVDYLVTLNAADRVDAASVLRRMVYEHPIYTAESVAAQRRLPELNTRRIAFAGAYHGWGFHEDGCASGVRAAEQFGAGW